MAAFEYKLEYIKNGEAQEDESVFIHFKGTNPAYMNKISKEAYALGGYTDPWMNGIFNIGGVVDASSLAYRVWVAKSPIYQWSDVLPPLLYFMMNYLGYATMTELPGSGTQLDTINARRPR
jgi:hypothetical protein